MRAVRALRAYWGTLSTHERRRHLTHVACLMWLGGSFAREWHAIGWADCAFLAMTLVSEVETLVRRQIGG